MKLALLTITSCFSILLSHSQTGCPDIDVTTNGGNDLVLPCSDNCADLTASPFHAGQTTNYTVGAIPHNPPISYTEPGGTAVSVGTDDIYSPEINLPFPFCFYGQTYTRCVVGSNGAIDFQRAGNTNHSYIINNNDLPHNNYNNDSKGDIFGVYHDIDPTVNGTVRWYLTGAAPCRTFIVVYNELGHYGGGCNTLRSTFMMVLYETTNVIEVYVQEKETCNTWQGGRAVIGLQGQNTANGIAAPGRNATNNWAVTTPEAWQFVPNGAPIYTVDWLEAGNIIGSGNTINVCPNGDDKTYTARATYTRCDGLVIVEEDIYNITYDQLPAPTVNTFAESCESYDDGSVVIDNSPGSGPYTIDIAGPASASFVEPNSAGANATFNNLPDGNYTFTVTSTNGCTYDGNFVIGPGPLCCSVTVSGTNLTCNGNNSGTVTATPIGLAPFNYSWAAGGQTSQTATGLAAGTYTVTMTDASGCVATDSEEIVEPDAIIANATPTNVSCFNDCDGQISVSAPIGGTVPFEYSINAAPLGNSNTFNNLCNGTYNILIKDDNGCQLPINGINVDQPSILNISEIANNEAVCGQNTGSTTVEATGGESPYEYQLGATTNTTGVFTTLSSGQHIITVSDDNNCTETIEITIDDASGPTPFTDVLSNVPCTGGINGSVSIGVNNGQAPYEYSLTGGAPYQNSNTFTLSANIYTVTVKDANNCTDTVNFEILDPAPLTISTSPTNVLCNGGCDGIIDVTITTPLALQNGPYMYSSDNGSTFDSSSSLTGLCATLTGINVVVSDASGCLTNENVPMSDPAPLTSTFNMTEPTCFNGNDGSISITPTNGGTNPYEFSINGTDFFLGSDFFGQEAGLYNVVVRDDHGCEVFLPGSEVTQPPQIQFDFVANNPSNCGGQDGSFEITANSGTPPYEYSIGGPSQLSGEFTNLFSGLYTLVVEDDNGCQDSTFSALSDLDLTSNLDGTVDVTCYNGNDGLAQVSVNIGSGGVAPYTYVLSTLATGYESPPQASGVFLNLLAGQHAITLTDNSPGNACINVIPVVIIQSDTISFDANKTDATCPTGTGAADGTITFSNPNGGSGSGYEYCIEGGTDYQTSNTFTGLTAGTYTLFVKDDNNCEGQSTITIDEPTPFDVTVNVTPLTCNANNSGFVQVIATGASGSYQFDFATQTNNSGIFAGLAASTPTYNLTVTDDNNCVYNHTPVAVTEPDVITALYITNPTSCEGLCDGQVVVNANGGTPTLLYSPDGGTTYQASNILENLCAGDHTIRIKDDNDCTLDELLTIDEPDPLAFIITPTNTTCGLNNGELIIAGSGGSNVYEYQINDSDPFVTNNNFTGLAVDVYDVVMQDNNGCDITEQAIISSENSPTFITVDSTNLLCNGDSNGTITSTANGGSGTLTYDIGPGTDQANGNFTGLTAGLYTLTVTDQNACTDVKNITIGEPTPLTHTETFEHLNCFGDNSGVAIITPSGGTSPYTYSFTGGAPFGNDSIADYLAQGNHDLIVKDANNCTSTSTVILTEPTQLAVLPQNFTDASCFGYTDGTATVNVDNTTGTGPYTYSWSHDPGLNNITALGLAAGGYVVDITDSKGCFLQEVFVIDEAAMVTISSVSGQNVSCNGGNDGELTINANNITDYTINYIGGTLTQNAPNNTFNNLSGQTSIGASTVDSMVYEIVVSNGTCAESYIHTIYQPTPVVLDPVSPIQICYEGTGTLLASATGGTVPYHFVWEGADTTSSYVVTSTVDMNASCIAYDLNGCPSQVEVGQITVPNGPFSLDMTATVTAQTICSGGAVTITTGGNSGWPFTTGTPYVYHLIDENQDTLSETAPFTYTPPSTPGIYTVEVIGHDECFRYDTIPVIITVNDLPIPTFSTDAANGCIPHSPTLTNTTPGDMTGATVTWTLGNGTVLTGTNPVTSLYEESGCYDITMEITTATGCSGTETYEDAICVNENPIANFYFNPALPTTSNQHVEYINNSENAETFSWKFADLGTSTEQNPIYSFNTSDQQTYEVCLIAISEEGCKDTICQDVTIYEELLFYIPNVFTPDGDDYNEEFKPIFTSGFDPYDYHLIIFNRWGETVFESYDAQFGWKGLYADKEVQDGMYIWQIEFGTQITDERELYRGHIMLLK